ERSTLMDMNVSFKVEIRDLNNPGNDTTTIDPGQNTGGGGNTGNTGTGTTGTTNNKGSFAEYLDFKVFYNDKEVAITNNTLPKPDADVKVMFKMTNKMQKRLGVVVLVNGINTVASNEKMPDREPESCSRWVLEPGKTYGVYGFH